MQIKTKRCYELNLSFTENELEDLLVELKYYIVDNPSYNHDSKNEVVRKLFKELNLQFNK